ncbi:MAG TPA: hypothetical protein VF121_04195, partial [Thermoanaerobaculia bacterium]|nr:hypothetical protein [Thermoanaerobaculia bacterium]
MATRTAARRRAAALWAAAVLFAAVAGAETAPPPEADPFYAGLLLDGAHAYDRGDFAAAARDLRLACFGSLDQPLALAGCLTRLGAAQAKSGDDDGFADTFRRVVEVEGRFGAYARADVPAPVRAAFEERVAAAIPAATLAQVPVFAPLAARKAEAERLAKLSPKQRRLEEQRKPDPRRQAIAA